MRIRVVVLLALVPIVLSACIHGPDRDPTQPRNSVPYADQPYVDLAWTEFLRRGGSMPRESTTVSVRRSRGNVFVEFEFLPRAPGGHFEVTIEEGSREVVGFEKGF